MSDDDWDWELTEQAKRELEPLDDHARDRIVSKLDDIVTDQWREPTEYLTRSRGLLTRSSGAAHSAWAVGPIGRNRFSTCSESGNGAAMPTVAMTTDCSRRTSN